VSEESDLRALARSTQAVYEKNAARFDRERPKGLFERPWLDRFLSHVAPGGRVLDAGCGTGDPVARYIADRGFRITGLDAADAMLSIARARFPDGDWRNGDMRSFALSDRFDGIVAWDSFFHLTADEQPNVLARFARHLAPGGALLLTVGPEAGEVSGWVGDDAVYHASLSPAGYEQELSALGLAVRAFVPEDPDCDFHTVLLAQRSA
jgi:ubiquinone/menaquinone biosynthesis C-methylase UbiE